MTMAETQPASEATKPAKQHRPLSVRLRPAAVWLCRIIVGCTFILSGFAKADDPRGFILKIEEYLSVWHIDWLWDEVIMTIAVAIAVVEFCIGVLLLTGCLRRTMALSVMAFMAVMLPLTAYIAVANPVADCGCFGDALVISNSATFAKNIVITAMGVYLLRNNRKVPGLYPPLIQYMVLTASMLYALIFAFAGIMIQPIVDFRPYKVGTDLVGDIEPEINLIYERDGRREVFSIDALPDSTWTYVGRAQAAPNGDTGQLAVFDGDVEVTSEVIADEGPQVLLVIPDVTRQLKARASMANGIHDYIETLGGSMICLVGADGQSLEQWQRASRPSYDVYTADDSKLREIVRGDIGIVYLVDGKIMWKRNIFSLAGDFPDFTAEGNQFDRVKVIDSGRPFLYLTGIYAAALLIIFLLGLIRIKNSAKTDNH